jgi:hypothetical protein
MNIPAILQAKFPGNEWTLDGDTYEGLTWLSDTPKPTQAELEDAWPEVQQTRIKAAMKRKRQAAFIKEADSLFFGWQRGENTEQAWLDKVAEIRGRYPYP